MKKRKAHVTYTHDVIRTFCRKNHISSLSLFGSVMRDDFTDNSDIDVLIEFEAGHVPGFDYIRIQDELSGIFGRKVDLNTPAALSPYFRQDVLKEAEPVYVSK